MMYNYKINSNAFVISAVIFTLVVIPLLSYTTFAVSPIEQFVYQGLLKDGNRDLITGQKDITLRIYTTSTGGEAPAGDSSDSCPSSTLSGCIWQENQTNIGVAAGVFTINAGNTTSFSSLVNFTNALFLEVAVLSDSGNDEILSPRINMTASPFALSAARASVNFDANQKNIINITIGLFKFQKITTLYCIANYNKMLLVFFGYIT